MPRPGTALARTAVTYQVWVMKSVEREELALACGSEGIAFLQAQEEKLKYPPRKGVYIYILKWIAESLDEGPQVVWDSIRGVCSTDIRPSLKRILWHSQRKNRRN